jgi:hydrogenase maturation protease
VTAQRIVIIGVGNPWRRDDGAGWTAADLAGARLGSGAAVVHSDGEPARLIDDWTDADLAVVVDAVRNGGAPGQIYRLDAGAVAVAPASRPTGSHALGVADAVRLGAAVGLLPRRLVVFGIEVADTSPGRGLSIDVARAAHTVAHSIEHEIGASAPRSLG